MKSKGRSKNRTSALVPVLLFILLVPLWVPLFILILIFNVLLFISLHLAVWLLWLPRSKHLLLVYSNSPVWQSYIESRILPLIHTQAVVLNWSEHRRWPRRWCLAVAVFKFFGGSREFNPVAVVFRPFRRAKVFRFFRPFQDLKHGKPESIAAVEHELFQYLHLPEVQPSA